MMRDVLSHWYSLRHKAGSKFSEAGTKIPPLPNTSHMQPATSEDTAINSENKTECGQPRREGDAISSFGKLFRNTEIFLLNCSILQYSHSRTVTLCKFRE